MLNDVGLLVEVEEKGNRYKLSDLSKGLKNIKADVKI